MYTRAFVKSLILPSISVGVVRAEGKEDECDNTRKLVRPRDLALYVDPPKCVTCSNTVESEDGFLLTTIRCARQELQSVLEQAKIIQAEASSMLDNIKKETSDAVSYLQQEENLLPRMGAIGMGAFAGYILAVRKGILKKILYSAAGAGAIAAVAYPNEAREYSEEVLCELKKYAVIGYHFVNGVDVDWKKLNEKYRCFEKNGITGGLIEAGPRRKAGEVTRVSPADQKSQEKSIQGKPGGDMKTSQSKLESTSELAKTDNNSNLSSAEPAIPQTGSGNSTDNHMSKSEPCPTPSETPLPQDRPKNANEPRPYKSYSDECKAKSVCTNKQPSRSSDLPEGRSSKPDSNGSRMQTSKSPENPREILEGSGSQQRPQSSGTLASQSEYQTIPSSSYGPTGSGHQEHPRSQPAYEQRQPPLASGPDAQEACIVGNGSNKEDHSTNPNASDSYQMGPQSGRSTDLSPGSSDSKACVLPDVNSQIPRSGEPGGARNELNGQGSDAGRPRTAWPNGGTPCVDGSNVAPETNQSPPPSRSHEPLRRTVSHDGGRPRTAGPNGGTPCVDGSNVAPKTNQSPPPSRSHEPLRRTVSHDGGRPTAGSNGGTPCMDGSNVAPRTNQSPPPSRSHEPLRRSASYGSAHQPWPTPPPYRSRDIPERIQERSQSHGQGASQSVGGMRRFSSSGTTGSKYQERPQSRPSYEQWKPAPQTRDSSSNPSADEGSIQSSLSDCKDGCCMRRSKRKSAKAEYQVPSET